MQRNDYQEAFDDLQFSDGFQERTAALLHLRADELEKEHSVIMKSNHKKIAVLIAACVALAVSVSAAVMKLSPSQVATENGHTELAEAFESKDAIVINETVESGDFAITLMGLVSGENLKDYTNYDPPVEGSRTYAVLALRRLDGTPVTNENYDFSRHTMTPLVAGCSPAGVNDWTLGGGACGFAKDGIYYYLLDTQSLEIFADHTVYIAFYEGGVPNNTIFTVADDGTISFCDDFIGVHALFTIPLDPAKADPAAVDAFLEEFNTGWTNERTPMEDYDVREEDTPDGKQITIIPSVPENGTPYTADEFEQDLQPRRDAMKQSVERGQYTQEYYDQWNQHQEDILAGLRDGSIIGLRGQKGYDHYFYDVAEDGSILPDRITDDVPVYATEDEFIAYMESETELMKKQLADGTISQASFDKSVQELEQYLEGIQKGTLVALIQPDGGLFVGSADSDFEYRLDEDGNTVCIVGVK